MGLRLKRMNAGDGATSYNNNSALQKLVISKTWCVLDETLKDMFTNEFPKCIIRMADLGCGPGPNTLLVVSHIIDTTKRFCELNNYKLPQLEVFLSDLPGNDFNNLFKCLHDQKEIRELLDGCFIYGAPGSFYGSLFPTNTLHFVYSSYSLHWLSQVPEGVGENNKENIHISMTSPPQVFEAYAKQFQRDFSRFLRIRGEEIVGNGRIVLTFNGRRFVDVSTNDGLINFFMPLAQILLHMVAQGIVKEKDLYSFNVPLYCPCMEEIEAIIRDEGSFYLEKIEVTEVPWDAHDDDDDIIFDKHKSGKIVAACARALMEPMLVSHFGPSLDLDGLFDIYAHKIGDHFATQRPFYFSPVISLTRKGSQN